MKLKENFKSGDRDQAG